MQDVFPALLNLPPLLPATCSSPTQIFQMSPSTFRFILCRWIHAPSIKMPTSFNPKKLEYITLQIKTDFAR
jgi:hypothetical protein